MFKKFFDSYVETALWLACDEEGNSADFCHPRDISPEAFEEMRKDCEGFYHGNFELIKGDIRRAGRDFFLTRNRHGAGFWDGDWPEETGKKLTEMAHPYGSQSLWWDCGRLVCMS